MNPPPIDTYQLIYKPGITEANGVLEYIHIEARDAGEPLKMVHENDGLWRKRLSEIFGEDEALAIMVHLVLGQDATVRGTYTRETLEDLHFHPDLLRVA